MGEWELKKLVKLRRRMWRKLTVEGKGRGWAAKGIFVLIKKF